jgi:hypothetical protein
VHVGAEGAACFAGVILQEAVVTAVVVVNLVSMRVRGAHATGNVDRKSK